ncbi:MAG: 2-amino-4-hydroxy-6-hydroxymethyldihydropteridine diphosphokinase [Gammaproteobacteria bacterium]|nr:2-amino-4-hydroxy-6-hydroxymethyldihydropteridine diphosphokinase [Gammaproteobacteria bacterium]
MARIYISIGSNIEREPHIRAALAELRAQFTNLRCSSVYESEPVGFQGDNFFNAVVACDTDKSVHDVARCLSQIEAQHGRVRLSTRFAARTLDLDLLLYDALVVQERDIKLPRAEILVNAFVLCPLAEIAPDERHPVAGKTYTELWRDFPRSEQRLWTVEFKQ